MKKFLVVICSIVLLALSGCSKNSTLGSKDEIPSQPALDDNADTNQESDPENTKAVKAQVQVYEGCYRDETIHSYEGVESVSPQIYYDIIITNVTDTSFDFTIYEKLVGEEKEELIFATNTAVFIEDGTEAVFHNNETTLSFTFPFIASDLVATTMKINGFELLEEKSFTNNDIPGHEAR